MNRQSKIFISPGSWFSLNYPSDWSEFEDMEGSFLFYDPVRWTGNFRISAFRAEKGNPDYQQYAQMSIREELEQNRNSEAVEVAGWKCAYGKETFQEEGVYYTTHLWITGKGQMVFECSFTVPKGGDKKVAEEIIASLQIREAVKAGTPEIIPARVLEIGTINESYEWASATVKKIMKKDFTASADDIPKIQQITDSGQFKPGQKEVWQSLGIAFGAILVNEIDGMEWITVIDGPSEFPALRYEETELLIYPMQLILDKIEANQPCELSTEYNNIRKRVEALYI